MSRIHLPQHIHSCPHYQHHLQNDTFVTKNEPKLTHYNHPESAGLLLSSYYLLIKTFLQAEKAKQKMFKRQFQIV